MGDTFRLLGFGPTGWGASLIAGAFMTLAVSLAAYAIGLVLGGLGAWGKAAGRPAIRRAVDVYTTVFRGIPELLVIYLIYFGGSQALTSLGHLAGQSGFIGLNGFLAGALAVGVIGGAYLTEAIRGGFLAIPRGEIEAGRAVGMSHAMLFRRVLAPRTLRFALPTMGNVWQQVLKESGADFRDGIGRADAGGEHCRRFHTPALRLRHRRDGTVPRADGAFQRGVSRRRALGLA